MRGGGGLCSVRGYLLYDRVSALGEGLCSMTEYLPCERVSTPWQSIFPVGGSPTVAACAELTSSFRENYLNMGIATEVNVCVCYVLCGLL